MTLTAPIPIAAEVHPLSPTKNGRITETTEDREIREGLVNQREEALSEAYRRFGQKVYRTAFGVLRRSELAEDVTQEVFVRIWQRPERFDPSRGSLGGFLQLDAHGRSVDLLRSEKGQSRSRNP